MRPRKPHPLQHHRVGKGTDHGRTGWPRSPRWLGRLHVERGPGLVLGRRGGTRFLPRGRSALQESFCAHAHAALSTVSARATRGVCVSVHGCVCVT